MKKILIVDDEPTLVATLRYNFEREGYEVLNASDGEEALALARSGKPDVMVLDLTLPSMSGLEVCRILRRETSVPILMLTARGEEIDKVLGLELGADDYLTKPFGMRELIARVKALIRRGETQPVESDILSSGDVTLNVSARQASRDEQALPLKPKEFDLLAFLMRHPGRVFSRERLLDEVWGYGFAGETRTVDVHVSWLRHKIEQRPGKPVRIVTVRGSGYRFDG